MERDLEFLRSRLMDEMSLGLFLVDTREYKDTLFNEIRAKIAFAKKLMKEKFLSSIEQCMSLGEKILAKMSADAKTVKEYINLSLYL